VLRRRLVAWIVAVCWIVALSFWGIYKIAYEGETEAGVFQALGLVLIALLMVARPDELRSPQTRSTRSDA
jgi:hypothetical protein